MSKKHAEVKPSLNEWVVHPAHTPKPLAIASSRVVRDQYGGYTFTGTDGIVADFPPGTVQYVTRKPRVAITMTGTGGTGTLTATGGTILAGGGSSGSGGSGSTGAGATPADMGMKSLPAEQRAAAVAAEIGADPSAQMTPGQHAAFAKRFEQAADPE